MKISFSATNPCHVYEWAVELHRLGKLGHYYSGYPGWKLKCGNDFPLITASFRTLVTYALYRFPEYIRPSHTTLFRWQDMGFDKKIAQLLEPADFIHGMPSQCAETFAAAKRIGVKTVLNHASGPVKQQLNLVEPEYERAQVSFDRTSFLTQQQEAQEEVAYVLADYHCVASSVVKEQLVADGCDPDKIWVIPYGVDETLFPKSLAVPPAPFKICFAGMLSIRKGIHYLLKALEKLEQPDWSLSLFGQALSETDNDRNAYTGATPVEVHGAVSRTILGAAFHQHHVLVLPSVEEAFGLVVAQALQAGMPCIVSDRVGAKDLIRHRENGSVFPFGDVDALAEELLYWEQHAKRVDDTYSWADTARALADVSEKALER